MLGILPDFHSCAKSDRGLRTAGWVRILSGEAHIPFILYVPGGGGR